MNVLIIYKSYYKMNTEKVATEMAGAMNATLRKVEEVGPDDLVGYDLIGIGSGIYSGKHHKDIFTLLEEIPTLEKDVFLFSTSGRPQDKYHDALKELLIEKGCRIKGEFQCPGKASFLGLNLINRGHPDEQDLENARTFAKGLIAG